MTEVAQLAGRSENEQVILIFSVHENYEALRNWRWKSKRAAHGKLIFRKILLIRATTGQILEMEIKQQRLPIENKFAEAFI